MLFAVNATAGTFENENQTFILEDDVVSSYDLVQMDAFEFYYSMRVAHEFQNQTCDSLIEISKPETICFEDDVGKMEGFDITTKENYT
jgi:hypothetical protein